MERWKESQLEQISSTTELGNAFQSSLNFIKNLGFKFFAFSTTCPTKTEHSHTSLYNNYPVAWSGEYEGKKLVVTDPVVAHCNESTLPVLWSEDLFGNAPWIWDALEQQGIHHGWSQAVHDEDSGLCSIVSVARSHCPISAWELYENLGFTTFIGRHLHSLVAQTVPRQPEKSCGTNLSPREIDVLNLAAAGKTAYESARILNLSARTVNFHVQESIRKLGVNNKVSAVIAAAKAGYLNSDAMR
ncbi:LuxR family transcriptional regulator [Pseudomonas sp. REP124]|uniref:helix-turn-helix transcriptional regulator n=1 Tax=Pseudomonas sp. REP124 TaxID=2875731 RepID=UPI001CCF6221|nr:LuxR family transcriptional regulator [Pseudomonas sp. REP124]MBZ9781301.1 LuxR family transcriptional regulator [Pseudomonas sp. REP124]